MREGASPPPATARGYGSWAWPALRVLANTRRAGHAQLGVWGSAVSSPIGVWGEAPEALQVPRSV